MNEIIAVILLAVLVFTSGIMLFKRKQLLPKSEEIEYLPFVILIRLLDMMTAVVFVVGVISFIIAFFLLLVKWFG